jgi:hypothetical protein
LGCGSAGAREEKSEADGGEQEVKTIGIYGAIGVVVVGIGGASFMIWWNGELTQAKLDEVACQAVQGEYGLPTTCEITTRQTMSGEWKVVGATVQADRLNEWKWFESEQKLHSTGKYTVYMFASVPIIKGDLMSLTRPHYGAATPGTDAGKTDINATWKLLETEPNNAAFDAMMNNAGQGEGAVTFMSALRRYNRMQQAIRFFAIYWGGGGGFYTRNYEEKLAEELNLIEQAPLEAADRKLLEKTIATYAKDESWKPVFDRLKYKRLHRQPKAGHV